MKRRNMMFAAGAAMVLGGRQAAADIIADPTLAFREVAHGLRFPEGPVAMRDGSLLVVEIARRTLSRISPDGVVSVVADLGGGPNGAAIGPDGACYVCNDGGITFIDRPDGRITASPMEPADYVGGSIQRVDLSTGDFTTLYTEAAGFRLKAPNDLVFDESGGFWFTDTGKAHARNRDHGGVYWATTDGSEVREVIYPLLTPNGIALSPDRRTLYVAISDSRQIFSYEIVGSGALKTENGVPVRTVVASVSENLSFDSMAVEANGNIVIGTVRKGGLTTITPDGSSVRHMALPDFVVAHLAFGGDDMQTVYACLSSTGRIVAIQWPRPGLRLLYT